MHHTAQFCDKFMYYRLIIWPLQFNCLGARQIVPLVLFENIGKISPCEIWDMNQTKLW
jgi:hypothetical protein